MKAEKQLHLENRTTHKDDTVVVNVRGHVVVVRGHVGSCQCTWSRKRI